MFISETVAACSGIRLWRNDLIKLAEDQYNYIRRLKVHPPPFPSTPVGGCSSSSWGWSSPSRERNRANPSILNLPLSAVPCRPLPPTCYRVLYHHITGFRYARGGEPHAGDDRGAAQVRSSGREPPSRPLPQAHQVWDGCVAWILGRS